MQKSELIRKIANKSNISLADAEKIINSFFDIIIATLEKGERIEIRGFGNFSVRQYKAYQGRNPATGDVVEIPEKKLPFWKTGLELRELVDGKR